jgi:hypothetical protein
VTPPLAVRVAVEPKQMSVGPVIWAEGKPLTIILTVPDVWQAPALKV